MKPIYLEMSAFGPYSNVENVDFTRINNELFLISGDTGSGKTTIFDAIVFALYGEASGNIRQSNSLRSDFADDDTETYVELTFECNGKEYYIRRSPEYLRKKKKGTGYTKKAADAILKYPDGRVVTKACDVTDNVVDLMGITKEQFTNIAMIAQGDFLKLILAKTDDRSKIFRDIFNTGKYLDIQNSLKTEMFERKEIKSKFEESIFQYENDTVCDEASGYSKEHKLMISEKNINRIDEFIKLIDEIIESDKRVKIQTDDKRKKYDELHKNISELIRLYKEKTDKSAEIEKLKNTIINDNLAIEETTCALDEHNAKRDERDKNFILYNEINSKLDEYEKLDITIKKELELRENNEKQNTSLVKLNKETEKLRKDLDNLKALEKEYHNTLKLLNEYKLKQNDYENKNTLLDELIKRKKNIDKLNKSLEKEEQKYLEKEKNVDNAKAIADKTEKSFLRAQAGIMAGDLEEGKKCPVCGSLSHPEPAKLSLEAATQEEVKEKKKIAEDLVKELEKAGLDYSHIKGKLETEKSMYEESGKKISDLVDYNDYKEVERLSDKLKCEIAELNSKILQYNQFIHENDNISDKIIKCEEKISSNTSKMQSATDKINVNLIEMAKTNTEVEKIKQGLKYPTKQVAQTEINRLNTEIKKYDKASEQLSDKLRKLNEEKKGLEGQIKAFNKEIGNTDKKISEYINVLEDKNIEFATSTDKTIVQDNEDIILEDLEYLEDNATISKDYKVLESKFVKIDWQDTQAVINEKKIIEKDLKVLEEMSVNAEYRIRNNEKAIANIRKTFNERKNVIKEYLTYQKLSNVANGMISGKDKITFERYVQGTYFEYIINAANKRLIEMTDGRYELLKKKDNNLKAQTGLELDIKDAYTGKVRGVNTLSGGEAFKASLSMALGLSDVVQGYAGGIKLDSMFIDEGFGSLDHESLEKAINILNDLSDGKRMIGIISHISELNERIDKKIHIEKSNEGSRISCLF
ncbi:MAG: SMC family ATPase [Lachnospiraceae bacterium]|nr:SMC family ATPase [Lachnospiraceae bacterium]